MLNRRELIAGMGLLACPFVMGGCESRLSGFLSSSDTHPDGYPTVEAVRFIGSYLADRTNGRLDVKVFPGGQFGSETDTLEIASFGGLDMTRVNLAPLNSIEGTTIALSLPFIFRSTSHMRRVVDSEIGDEVLASLARHGLIGLCIYDSGERSVYNNRRPIVTPDDLRGLKLRVPASDLYIAMINALGANAVPIPLGEVYQALAQGVIDGAENNWPSLESGRHYEVAPFYSLTNHLMTPEVLVMGKPTWDGLTQAEQLLVREAAKASVDVMRQAWDQRVNDARAALVNAGIRINAVDPEPFAERMKPVWNRFIVTDRQRSQVARILAMAEA